MTSDNNNSVVRVKLTGRLAEIVMKSSKELGMSSTAFVKANLAHLLGGSNEVN